MTRDRHAGDPLDGLDDDLSEHLAHDVDELVAQGVPPDEARRRARIALGNPALIVEDTRAVWTRRWFDDLKRDVAYARRSLRRAPAFTVAAAATLSLGVGVVTVLTSVAYGVLVRPLPFENADRLVRIVQVLTNNGGTTRGGLRPEQIASWQAHSQTLTIGYTNVSSFTLTGVPEPARLAGAAITPALFRGIAPAASAGRVFDDGDALPGNTDVVILAHRTWTRLFGGDGAVVGRTITLSDKSYRVVGVMPPTFEFPSIASPSTLDSTGALASAPEYWVPLEKLAERPIRDGGGFTLIGSTFGLLRPGVSIAQAETEANTLLPLMPSRRATIELVNPRIEQTRTVRPLLMLFQGAGLFVLFIACANVTNLLLARYAVRQREFALRLSLGAGRSRLIRQSITEGVVLGALGAVGGLALTWAGVTAVSKLPPHLLPRLGEIRIDLPALTLALALSVASGALVSLIAFLWGARPAAEMLHGSASGARATMGRAPLRVLVVAEIAAGLVLLTAAALLAASLTRLTRVDAGFDPAHVFGFRLTLPTPLQGPEAARLIGAQLSADLSAQPGVVHVSVGRTAIGSEGLTTSPEIDGRTVAGVVEYRSMTSPDYFDTLGIPLAAGRLFTPSDTAEAPTTAVVSAAFARTFFPDGDPIGHGVSLFQWPNLRIVGVVGDVRSGRPDAKVYPVIYAPGAPFAASRVTSLAFFVRTSGAMPALGRDVRAAARRLHPDLVVYRDAPIQSDLEQTYADASTYALVSVSLSLVGLTMAAVGLYGVLAFSVRARTREIGVRIAIGADRGRLIRLILSDALGMVVVGVAIGLGIAWYVGRFLEAWLFGVTSHDPASFALVAAVFLVVGASAAYLPARRATRVDPVVALRMD